MSVAVANCGGTERGSHDGRRGKRDDVSHSRSARPRCLLHADGFVASRPHGELRGGYRPKDGGLVGAHGGTTCGRYRSDAVDGGAAPAGGGRHNWGWPWV